MSRTFTARYPGRCVECDDGIEVGALLRFDDDDNAVHATCEAAASHPDALTRRPVVVCTTCWLTKPCDCEDGAA